MNQEIPQQGGQGQTGKGFGVAASPLNQVKLELGIILCVGLIIGLAVDSITPRLGLQLLILAVFGLVSAGWLLLRTRQVTKRLERSNETQ